MLCPLCEREFPRQLQRIAAAQVNRRERGHNQKVAGARCVRKTRFGDRARRCNRNGVRPLNGIIRNRRGGTRPRVGAAARFDFG